MAGIDRWNISPETRAKFEAILDDAPRLGIDRDQAFRAGLPGLRALIGLKKAAEALTRKTRTLALTETRDALRGVARRNPKLASQFEARILAMQGRGSDTEVAHLARGELVVPEALQSAGVLAVLREAATLHGIPLDRLRVGEASNSINPDTGSAEFNLEEDVDGTIPLAAEIADVQAQTGTGGGAGDGVFGSRRDGSPPRTHQGIDIQATVGEPIYASGPGTVVRADGRDARGYGNQVAIDHGNGVVTQVGHLDRMFVKPGERVSGGQPIGQVGRTGNSPKDPADGDAHAHYEVWVDGVKVDPTALVPDLQRRLP